MVESDWCLSGDDRDVLFNNIKNEDEKISLKYLRKTYPNVNIEYEKNG